MKDGEGFVWVFVILVLGVFILAAWMLYKMAEGIYHRPQIILLLALLVTLPIWLLPMVAAWIVIVLGRNWIVYLWHRLPNANAGFFLVSWVTVVPVLLAAAWLEIGYMVWSWVSVTPSLPVLETLFRIYPGWPDVVFAYIVASTPLVVSIYFHLYLKPLKHPNITFFIAAEEQMKFDTRLTLLRLKTGLRLIAGR